MIWGNRMKAQISHTLTLKVFLLSIVFLLSACGGGASGSGSNNTSDNSNSVNKSQLVSTESVIADEYHSFTTASTYQISFENQTLESVNVTLLDDDSRRLSNTKLLPGEAKEINVVLANGNHNYQIVWSWLEQSKIESFDHSISRWFFYGY